MAAEIASVLAERVYEKIANGIEGLNVEPGDYLEADYSARFDLDTEFPALREKVDRQEKAHVEHQLHAAWSEAVPDTLFDNPEKARSGRA